MESKGLFGLRESRVELAENKLILGKIYFTPPQFKWTITLNIDNKQGGY